MSKPFDLEAALAGAPVQTRDGRPVTQLTFTRSGRYAGSQSSGDLVMAPVKHEGWVNIYRDSNGHCYAAGAIRPTKEAAKAEINSTTVAATVKVKWEE